jgi:hypothetical protein
MVVADSNSDPDPPGRPLFAPIEIFQALSIIGVASYGTAWLLSRSMFARVNLRPEDVGISYEFLAVRSVYIAGALILLIGAVGMSTTRGNWLRLGRQGHLRDFHRLFVLQATAFMILSFVAACVVGRCLANTLDRRWIANELIVFMALLIATPLNYMQDALVLRSFDYRIGHRDGPGLGRSIRASPLLVVLAVRLFTFGTLAVGLGAVLGYRIERHEPAEFFFNIHPAQVTHLTAMDAGKATPTALDPLVTCGLVLGYSDGTVRIYSDDDEVMAFATENVTVVDMDKESCDLPAQAWVSNTYAPRVLAASYHSWPLALRHGRRGVRVPLP